MTAQRRHLRPCPPTLILAALVLLIGLAAPVRAQNQGQQEQTLEFLEGTDAYLEQVASLVQVSDSEQARVLLESARDKQGQAHQLYEGRRYAFALRLSRTARQIGAQADRMARGSQGFQERARQSLDRLHDLHEQVSERAADTGNAPAMALVRQAEGLYLRAREQYEQTHYEQSFRLLDQAEHSLRQAARLILESGDLDRLLEEQARVGELIATARDRLDGASDPALARALDAAAHTLDDARLALETDQPLRAMRLTQRARNETLRVLRQAGAGVDAAAVQREIDRFDARQDELSGADDAEAVRLLARARALRDQAVQALQQGDDELALRTIRSALNVQRQAGERLR
ncbi:MAG TPA: hypothetical protein P5571_13605 [Candidatus Krumholzibacteria bacterium]|nr:hypothetical protein [Candidatus Krumholzibacteria bacterium]HRX52400.1 hypothetical protein [Candidatus Krumholzibacteria bacterium]